MKRTYNFKLTKEQQQLVEDNHNLIYSYLHKRHLPIDSTFDFYGDAALGLCTAAHMYNPSLGFKFSVIAYKAMETEINNSLKRINKYINCILNTENLECFEEKAENELIIDYDYFLALRNIVNKYYKQLSDRDKQLIKMYLSGNYTLEKIGNALGISRQRVSEIIKRFRSNVKKDYYDESYIT